MSQTHLIRLLGFALVACLLATGDRSAFAEDNAPSEELLPQLRDMRYRGSRPSLTGFSPAKPIALASLAGGHNYTTAYQSASGCVAYFYPPSEKLTAVELKWEGASACNGKPLNGKGQLQLRSKDHGILIVTVMEGNFVNGMLTGQGNKINFSFTENGQPVEDTYSFSGEFANSVLNGKGEVRWAGPADSEPSGWIKIGKFKDAVPYGKILFARLHPFPNVEADLTELILNAAGETLLYQSQNNGGEPVNGSMWFYGDPVEWKVKTYVMKGGAFEMAKLERTTSSRRSLLAASCDQWSIQKNALTCEMGAILQTIQADRIDSLIANVERKPFSIPLPTTGSGVLFRVKENETVSIHRFASDRGDDMTCSADISRCTGKAAVHLTSKIYWWGDAEFRNGELQPVAARLLIHESTGDINPSSDRADAQCSSFSNPPYECNKGTTFLSDGVKIEGRFSIQGLNDNSREWDIVTNGKARITYANGFWADVYMEDDEVTSVNNCDNPASSNKFTCSLNGRSVMFREHFPEERRSSYEQNERSYNEYKEPPPRFVPTPIPQRQIYNLPGSP